MSPEQIERFWSRVNKTESCWLWTGPKDGKGYGLFGPNGSTRLVHRISYGMAIEKLPRTIHLDHICRERSCVNPDHLRQVTVKQNLEHRAGPIAKSMSGFRGVSMHKSSGLWQAKVTHGGRQFHLGYFKDPAVAGDIAKAKRLELFTHNDADRAA